MGCATVLLRRLSSPRRNINFSCNFSGTCALQHFAVYIYTMLRKMSGTFRLTVHVVLQCAPIHHPLLKISVDWGFQDLRELLWLRPCPNGTEGHTDGTHAAWPALQKRALITIVTSAKEVMFYPGLSVGLSVVEIKQNSCHFSDILPPDYRIERRNRRKLSTRSSYMIRILVPSTTVPPNTATAVTSREFK